MSCTADMSGKLMSAVQSRFVPYAAPACE
jgi:hypothetical protein